MTLAGVILGLTSGALIYLVSQCLAAWLNSLTVRAICFGAGPKLLNRQIGSKLIQIGFIPFYGQIAVRPIPDPETWAGRVFYSAGLVATGAAIIAVLTWVAVMGTWTLAGDRLWLGLAFGQTAALAGQSERRLRFGRDYDDFYRFFEANVGRYAKPTMPVLSRSPGTAQLKLYLLEARDGPIETHIQAGLKLLAAVRAEGRVTQAEELWLIDHVATYVTTCCPEMFAADLDAMTERAMALYPNLNPIRQTRGGALVQLGRSHEGLEMLVSSDLDSSSDFEKAIVTFHMALAQEQLGQLDAARSHLASARVALGSLTSADRVEAFADQINALDAKLSAS